MTSHSTVGPNRAMLSESFLARGSRSLLSSRSTAVLAKQAFHGNASFTSRSSPQSQHQQNALRTWTLLRVTAADYGGVSPNGSKHQQADAPVGPKAGVAKGGQQVGVHFTTSGQHVTWWSAMYSSLLGSDRRLIEYAVPVLPAMHTPAGASVISLRVMW